MFLVMFMPTAVRHEVKNATTLFFRHFFILALNSGFLVAAEEDIDSIRLICSYDYTINNKGERGGTSGEELFTVMPLERGLAIIRKQGLGAPFIGNISEEEIAGESTYDMSNVKVSEALVINRFTGEFQLSFKVVGKGGLIHFGSCRAASERLF